MGTDTPSAKPSKAEQSPHLSRLEIEEHPLYAGILRMVIWGEERGKVYERMEVNKVPADIADQLYAIAWKDRIRTIRTDTFRQAMIGLGLIVASIATFSLCWFGLGFIPKILLWGCFAAVGIGSWKAINGLVGYLMASSKTGSLADQ